MSTAPTDALLSAARAGDESAFGRLIEPYRRELHAHCYRMLGSVHDAEDVLQDVLVRAWRGLPSFEARSSLRTWLYRIATNACLNVIRRRPTRVMPMGYGPPADPHAAFLPPLTESIWLEPYPDAELPADSQAAPAARYELRESVELAFVAALQLLPARQRASLIMRDVLGFSASEVADSLGTTVASANSALARARKAIDEHLPEQSQQTTLRALGEARLQSIVRDYMDALERGDVEAVIALLTDDATWSMPPIPSWFDGPDAIRVFLRDAALAVRWKHVPIRANGQLAVACYLLDEAAGCYRPEVIDVLTLRGDRIAGVIGFVQSEMLSRFDLPAELPA